MLSSIQLSPRRTSQDDDCLRLDDKFWSAFEKYAPTTIENSIYSIATPIKCDVRMFAERMGEIPESLALAYLLSRGWSSDNGDENIDIYTALGMDWDQEQEGFPNPTTQDFASDWTCPLCFGSFEVDDDDSDTEPITPTDLFAMPCKHFFCKSCFVGHLRATLADGTNTSKCFALTCPDQRCKRIVTPDVFLKLLLTSPSSMINKREPLRLYAERIADNYVDASTHCQKCPNIKCNGVYCKDETGRYFRSRRPVSREMIAIGSEDESEHKTYGVIDLAQCAQCDETWCVRCQQSRTKEERVCAEEEDHRPATCERAKAWIKMQLPSGFEAYLAKAKRAGLIKCCPNPSCRTPVEKISGKGCLHMECKQCKSSFCWACLTMPYHKANQSGFYVCPVEEALRAREQSLEQTSSSPSSGPSDAMTHHRRRGDEERASLDIERLRIAREHYNRADMSLKSIRKELRFRIESQFEMLTSSGSISSESVKSLFSFVDEARSDLARGVRALKWVAVHKYFEYSFDLIERRFEYNMLNMHQGRLTRSVKTLFETLVDFPAEDIAKEASSLDCDAFSLDTFRNILNAQRRHVKDARANLLTQIVRGFPDAKRIEDVSKKHERMRRATWGCAKAWLTRVGWNEWSSTSSSIPKLEGCDDTNVLELAKRLGHAQWLAKLLYAEHMFPHRPWSTMPLPPKLHASNSTIERLRASSKVKQVWWWWNMPKSGHAAVMQSGGYTKWPFPKGQRDELEKAFLKWTVDRDELDFYRFFTDASRQKLSASRKVEKRQSWKESAAKKSGASDSTTATSQKQTSSPVKKRPKKALYEHTLGLAQGATQICRFHLSLTGCRNGSSCSHLHRKRDADADTGTDDVKNEDDVDIVTVSASLPFALGDFRIKIRVDFEKVDRNAITAGGGTRLFNATDANSHESVVVERVEMPAPKPWNCPCGNWVPDDFAICPITSHPKSASIRTSSAGLARQTSGGSNRGVGGLRGLLGRIGGK